VTIQLALYFWKVLIGNIRSTIVTIKTSQKKIDFRKQKQKSSTNYYSSSEKLSSTCGISFAQRKPILYVPLSAVDGNRAAVRYRKQ